MSKSQDVTLEVDALGNQYLHLILPAERINFLNGLNGASTIFGNHNGTKTNNNFFYQQSDDIDSQMLVEVGCKVFEVNRVAYKSAPQLVDYNFEAVWTIDEH